MKHHPIMRRHRMAIKRRTSPGAPPGMVVADPLAPAPEIWFVRYDSDGFEEGRLTDLSQVATLRKAKQTLWINVDGLGDADKIHALGEALNLHALSLEDVINTHQRPKVEEYDDHLYLVTRSINVRDGGSEQISLFLWQDMLLTFRESVSSSFDPVLERLRQSRGRIRSLGADYLAYSLLDANVDAFFPLLDKTSDELEALERDMMIHTDPRTLMHIHDIKHRLAAVRRIVSPIREVANTLIRDSSDLLQDATRIYLRDLYDHTIQIIELVENQREVVASLLEIYLSSVSNRMNAVMKVLTIIATLFIPLTFIVGVYGMNFDTTSPWNMPELHWRFGYPLIWLIMFIIVVLELYLFYRMGWMGKRGAAK